MSADGDRAFFRGLRERSGGRNVEVSKRMSWIDWIIVVIPVFIVMYAGWNIRKYITGVADFVVGGRVCRRYVITTGNMANALGLITLAAFIEVHYRTGFALSFWESLKLPISVMISLSGYCLYRFRETRALSIGQFLEMRYNRSLRIFACFLRSIAEMMANIIMPAIAARFFIAYLDLPRTVSIFGFPFPTFMIITAVMLGRHALHHRHRHDPGADVLPADRRFRPLHPDQILLAQRDRPGHDGPGARGELHQPL